MNIAEMFREDEKPLENLVSDGGFCGIFRTIGCVGDSLSSGEMEFYDDEGKRRCIDMYEYSWGQYIARTIGGKVYNFSRGGMTAQEYVESFAEENGYWDSKLACQAYIIALGVNDMGLSQKHRDEFQGYCGTIIERLKGIQPEAKFFLMTMMPGRTYGAHKLGQQHRDMLETLTKKYSNCYLLDFYTYGPEHDDDYREKFFMTNHLNPCGYILTAKMVMSYIDYIIRHNMDDFRRVALIGYEDAKKEDIR